MAPMIITYHPSRLRLEERFAKPDDDIKHVYVLVDLENGKPRPKPTRTTSKEQSVYVDRGHLVVVERTCTAFEFMTSYTPPSINF